MKSVDLLIEEHRLIERMLNVLEDAAARLERGGAVPPEMVEGILEFIEQYADERHHAKEEDQFFPALADRGLEPQASPINALKVQHESGRALVREMRGALPSVARGDRPGSLAFAATARDYVGLLREHIRIENHYFAEYGREFLTVEDDDALRALMDAVDEARERSAGVRRFHDMVAQYEEALLKC
jgi:hemerythrin-like domain-containing protein